MRVVQRKEAAHEKLINEQTLSWLSRNPPVRELQYLVPKLNTKTQVKARYYKIIFGGKIRFFVVQAHLHAGCA